MSARRPLRFCHISIFYPPYSFGGDAIYLYRLANALAQYGHEVDVIHCADSYRALERRAPTGTFPNHPGVTVHTLRSGWGIAGPLIAQQIGSPWLRSKHILRILNSKKFDVVHYHNISLFGPRVLELVPNYEQLIKLYTTHEHWLVCPMHVLWKNNERRCEQPDCFRCTVKMRRPIQWWRYTKLLERCTSAVDAFISPSDFTARMHHERGFAREFLRLPHFVPREKASEPLQDIRPHPRPFFLFAGRLEKIKGVQELLRVFRNYPHADLLIAGTGTYEAELRRQAQPMSNVVFLGPLLHDRLAAYFRHTIAVLVPSLCYEVFGLVCLEAFAHHTPVIVHNLGGLRELMEVSQGGFSYSQPNELLEAMEQLRTNPTIRRQKGEMGYRKYVESWSEEAHIDRYFRILEQVAHRKFGFIPWNRPMQPTLGMPSDASAGRNLFDEKAPSVVQDARVGPMSTSDGRAVHPASRRSSPHGG